MCNDKIIVLKNELDNLKKEVPKDGEAKFTVIPKETTKGWLFFKRKILIEQKGEIYEIGNYVSLKKICDIISDFINDIYFKIFYVKYSLNNQLHYTNIDLDLDWANKLLRIIFIKLEKRKEVVIDFKKTIKIVEDKYNISNECNIRKSIYNLVDTINVYKRFQDTLKSNKIFMSSLSWIELEDLENGFLNQKNPALNVYFGDDIQLTIAYSIIITNNDLFRNRDVRSIKHYEVLCYSNDKEVQEYLFDKRYKILSEIFIDKETLSDLLEVLKEYY